MRDAPKSPMDPGVEQRIADAALHRRKVARHLAGLLGDGWTEVPADASAAERQRATLAAMRAGARFVAGAQLPSDPTAGRRGGIDLLVRTGDGYLPILVVRHKITDPGRGARTSPLGHPWPDKAGEDPHRKVRSQPRDQLRLAHAVRLLQASEMSTSGRLYGGVIGLDADAVLWHDLEAPTWPGGRTALAEYDARFADRLGVASAAAAGEEPLAQPSRVLECRGCQWWPTCEATLHASRDVSLVVRGEDATVLRSAGASTVDDLARMSPEVGQSLTLMGTTVDDAVLMAKAWLRDVPLVRRVGRVTVPRADVELDVDMESFGDSGAYLWGCWLSGVDIGVRPGYHPFVTWDPLPSDEEARSFAAFWSWFTTVRRTARERGLSFRAYCYNEMAENRWLLRSAERFAGMPGIPTVGEIRAFIGSDQWVDLFAQVRDQFLSPHGKGLKVIAPSAGFLWRDPQASGENSMRWYRDAVGLHGQRPDFVQRRRLLAYNEDDVQATFAIRRWMDSAAVNDVPYAADL